MTFYCTSRTGRYLVLLLMIPHISPADAATLTPIRFIEVVFLGCALFYADIVSDIFSLEGFWARKRLWFFWINAAGIGINMVASAVLGALAPEDGLEQGVGEIVNAISGFLQLKPLFATYRIITTWTTPDPESVFIGALFRGFEFIEATFSGNVQGYSLVWDSELEGRAKIIQRLSVCVSVFSLANGLVLLDKPESRSCDVPKVKSPLSIDFFIVFSFRAAEITMSWGALFLFRLITRPYGVFASVGVSWAIAVTMLLVNRDENNVFSPDQKSSPFAVAILVILSIPLVQYYVGPVTDSPQLVLEVLPTWRRYFAMRCAWLIIITAVAYFVAGGVEEMWATWTSYTDTTPYVAMAVGASIPTYGMLGALIHMRYHSTVTPSDQNDPYEGTLME